MEVGFRTARSRHLLVCVLPEPSPSRPFAEPLLQVTRLPVCFACYGGIWDLVDEKANIQETAQNKSTGLDMLGCAAYLQDSKASFCRAWEPRWATLGSLGVLSEARRCGGTWLMSLLCPLVGTVAAGSALLTADAVSQVRQSARRY